MRKSLSFVGASLLLVGSAWAQTTTNTSDITQTGTGNQAAIENNQAGNRENRSVAVQNGFANSLTVLQVGTFNRSDGTQTGDENTYVHTQTGDFHEAATRQSSNRGASAVRQVGQSNRASVEQRGGNRNYSQVAQGVEVADADFFNALSATTARAGNDNRVTVLQVGNDLASSIRQRASATGVAAGNNIAEVTQRGRFNISNIFQESRGNTATVYQFEGGAVETDRNSTTITQGNTGATSGANPLSNNRASVAVSGQDNAATLVQDGRGNVGEVTQGIGRGNRTEISQTGFGTPNRAAVAQYGNANRVTIVQDANGANADIWQQAGVTAASGNNEAVVRQGTGATGSDPFSAAFFGNGAPTGAATGSQRVDITQGNNPGTASWNVVQILQDGLDVTATVTQGGTGSSALPNIVRIAQQGGSAGTNSAIAIQRAGTGPSAADAAATGDPGDPFYFAGGARSAEINILQSGSGNQATIEQRGLGQFGRIEQGPGSGNVASILQEAAATNATAVIVQTGSNNSYSVTQDQANQYIHVSQTGNGNSVTDVIRRGPGAE